MNDRHEPQGRLITKATALLGTESPWLVVSATPARPAPGALGTDGGGQLRRWVAQQVADWPAPIPLGTEPPDVRPDRLAFAPPRPVGRPASTYYCELHEDGSALGALQVGTLRHSPPDGRQVWALGEGAVAWITIAMLRLAAAFAHRASGRGEALVETAVLPCADPGRTAPLEVWNHAGEEYGPSGTRRLARVESARHTVDPAHCLTPALTKTARPFVLDLLCQFGLTESRHLGPAGVLRRGHFTGHSSAVRAWADAIGIPSEP